MPIREEAADIIRRELFARSPRTAESYRAPVARFLWYADRHLAGRRQGFTRDHLLEFFAQERSAGHAPASLRHTHTALRVYFRHLGEPLPLEGRALPLPRLYQQDRPQLQPEEVAQLVTAARTGRLSRLGTAWVALVTVYGLRRVELGRVLLSKTGLQVVTAKTGNPRQHRLPTALAPFVRGYRPLTPSLASGLWHAVARGAGLPEAPGFGWHAVRRALATALVEAGVSQLHLMHFMGWEARPTRSVERYYAPRPEAVDEAVFAVHPFLKLWEVSP